MLTPENLWDWRSETPSSENESAQLREKIMAFREAMVLTRFSIANSEEGFVDRAVCLNTAKYFPEFGDLKMVVSYLSKGEIREEVRSYSFMRAQGARIADFANYLVINHPQYPSYSNLIRRQFGDLAISFPPLEVVVVDLSNTDYQYSDEDWAIDWRADGTGLVYRQYVYPQALAEISKVVSQLQEPLVHVDLFGGDGYFVDLVAQSMTGRNYEGHVIDRNKNVLTKARALADKDTRPTIVVHDSRDLTTTEDVFDGVKSPYLVTALGGLCKQVIERDEAYQIAKKVYAGMAHGGVFIVSGHTSVLLNPNDLRGLGFTIERTSDLSSLGDVGGIPRNFYVLRKT